MTIVDGATALTSSVVPARRYGLYPDTATDMASALSNAFAKAPIGSTIVTEPGEYLIQSGVTLSRAVNLSIKGNWVFSGSSGLTVNSNVTIEGDGEDSYLDGTGMSAGGVVLNLAGSGLTSLGSPNADPAKHGWTLSFASAPSVSPRDVLVIYNATDSSWHGSRTYYREGEYCQVRNLNGTTIELTAPLYSGYTAANVTVYKLSGITANVRNLRIAAPDNTTKVMQVQFGVNCNLDGLNLRGSDWGLGFLDRCYNVDISKIYGSHLQTASSASDYGIVSSNCQHVRIAHSHITAYRHAFATGGSNVTGAVPNRDIRVSDSTLITTGNNIVSAVDLHGNSEWCEFLDCHVEGGYTLAGDNCKISGGISRTRGTSGVAGIYFTEMLGWNFTVENLEIVSNGGLTSRGAAIDLGGNAIAADANTTRNGKMLFRSVRLTDDATSPTAAELIRFRNRGCTSSYIVVFEDIDINVAANTMGTMFMDVVSGSSPQKLIWADTRANYFGVNLDDMGSFEFRDMDIEASELNTDCIDAQVTQNDSIVEIDNVSVKAPVRDGMTIFTSGAPTGCIARIKNSTIFDINSTYFGIEVWNGWEAVFMSGCHGSGSGTPLRVNNATTLIAKGNTSAVSTVSVTTIVDDYAEQYKNGFYNSAGGSPSQDVFNIWSSTLGKRIVFRDNMRASSSGAGGMEFWNFPGSTMLNDLFLSTLILGNSYPVAVGKGLVANIDGADADSRISGDTVTNLFYVDASTDRVGINTSTPGALLDVNGKQVVQDVFEAQNGFLGARDSVSGTVTVDKNHHYLYANTTGGTVTLNLPATDATDIGAGKEYIIKKIGSNTLTISPNGSNTIEGASSWGANMIGGDSLVVRSNGGSAASGNWEIIGDHWNQIKKITEKFKTSETQVVNNSTTLVDDDTLALSLSASTLYRFEFEFFWETDPAADFKFIPAFTGTMNANYYISNFSVPFGNTSTRNMVEPSGWQQWNATGGTETHGYGLLIGVIDVNAAGTLKLQWAQNTANVSDTKVLKGSRIRLQEVA